MKKSETKNNDLKFYVADSNVEKQLEKELEEVFQRYKKEDYTGIIFTCVKELINNAAKANLKRIIFENNHIEINNTEEYDQVMAQFKSQLNSVDYQKYEKDLKKGDFWITVKIEDNHGGLLIEVLNNTLISQVEDIRMRDKLKLAMGYDNIAQFYIEQSDELEGAGMGIALIIILLKGLNIDPSSFRIGNTKGGQTSARLEIPLVKDYLTKREKR